MTATGKPSGTVRGRGAGPRHPAWTAGVVLAAVVFTLAAAGPAVACALGSLPVESRLVGEPDPTRGDGGHDDEDYGQRENQEESALALLDNAARAARETPYQGVQFVSNWGRGGTRTVLVEIKHVPRRGTVMTVVGTAADPGTRVYARDDIAERSARLRGMSSTVLRLLARNYTVAPGGEGSVAGRAAAVVEARRGDGSVAARFWVDREAGLLLRRQVFDDEGRVVRANAFIDLRLGAAALDTHLPPAAPRPWRDTLSGDDVARLRAQGWTIPQRLPGGLVLVEARKKVADNSPVLHLGYSDGLSMISLFVQRGRLDTKQFEAWHRGEFAGNPVYVHGAAQQHVVWAGPEYVYTVVADAPPGTVREAVAALPHEEPPGFWTRVLRGLERIGTWLNPFG